MTEQTNANEKNKRSRVGTIEGTALILGVLLLIVVFYAILPEMRRFNEYISKDTIKLQEAVITLQVEQARLTKQLSSTNYEREIGEMKSVHYLLQELESKSASPIKEQIAVTNQEIEKLLDLLKNKKSE
ncbi:hypothetical protein JXQ70_04130 [bacterium]|nr:hypothetical protein [bacterium]